ncbi:MAG TPA: TetR/AcrR family transcriptional regulator, partial [Solirubrobacterales bacterium]|nr:TetR/AcrR family transcriptional regulator [Solirubrobacterales bacterium]
IFTAGNIAWQLDKPADHLATRDEVLDHLRHCVDVARTKVDLEERFGCEYVDHTEAGDTVAVTVRDADGRIETLTTKRLIKAYGNHVLPSPPLSVSSAAVRPTTPEALSGLIAERPGDSSPVWIVGSGKTAMDVALMLRRACPGRELNMVAGSGTMFSRRETFFPTGPRRWYAGTRINAMLRQAALRFDGTNEREVAAWFADAYGISPSAEPANFFAAYLSDAECAEVRAGVRRIEPGHLADVLDTPDGPAIALRGGRSLTIPAGSWVVNCTGYLAQPRRPYEPFVSDTGNVLSIQLRSSVTGPFTSFAGYHLTHLMFRDRLRAARLYELDLEDLAAKSRSAIIWASITLSMYNLGRFARALPPKVMIDCGLDFDRWYPGARRLAGATALLATQPWDAPRYRRTLDTLGERFDVRVGPAQRQPEQRARRRPGQLDEPCPGCLDTRLSQVTKLLPPGAGEAADDLSVRQVNVAAFLDAAERLLVREGAAGISTRQLGREAGQNHGLVHYYFGSVDELLLQALERFTSRVLDRQRSMYESDAPFLEKWRAAMGFIDDDLASGYPKVWAELEALGRNKPELRERLNEVDDHWRTLLRDACAQAIEEYGLERSGFSAEAWATLVMQFNKGLLAERLLGFDRGHAEMLASIDAWLVSLQKGKK